MDSNRISALIGTFVKHVIDTQSLQGIEAALRNPKALVESHLDALEAITKDESELLEGLRGHCLEEPFLRLQGCFEVVNLPDTPQDFLATPLCEGVISGKLATVTLNYLCDLDTVSYGSENSGQLFVNLVAMPGSGVIPEKSHKNMRGHTDAASFPLRGRNDPVNPRIAPSPDLVCLVALRNPNRTPTIVMPLGAVLEGLHPMHVEALYSEGFQIYSQRTFRRGTQEVLGEEHFVTDCAILYSSLEGIWIRYSHSNVSVQDESNALLAEAKSAFEASCLRHAQEVVLEPGDLLLVNNRKALHGRGGVGPYVGGETRWLMRTYSLDTSELRPNQWQPDSTHKLYP